jgi:hypothetical protein
LVTVGRTLDFRANQVVDVTVALIDDEAQVSGLEWRDATLYGAWARFDLRIDTTRPPMTGPLGGPPGVWTFRLGGIGKLLDKETEPMRDVSVLEVEGGFIVQMIVPAEDQDPRTWCLKSREIPNEALGEANQGRSTGFLTRR